MTEFKSEERLARTDRYSGFSSVLIADSKEIGVREIPRRPR